MAVLISDFGLNPLRELAVLIRALFHNALAGLIEKVDTISKYFDEGDDDVEEEETGWPDA